MPRRVLIVHSGAGGTKFPLGEKRFQHLRTSVNEGMAAMKRGSSIDAVEAAVRFMENCGSFNAGRGASTTAEGTIQLDAAIMEGKTLRGAGVAVCECTYHPVTLARALMERTDHVLIAGPSCARFARAIGMKIRNQLRPSPSILKRLAAELETMKASRSKNYAVLKLLEKHRRQDTGNTVGAVALDQDGVPAAAASTGGTMMKLPGRIGDSPIIGAGLYADRASGAACATGKGEEIIRCALCWNACDFMKDNGSAILSASRSIGLITNRSGRGTAGIITVDLKGRVGFAYNTEAMGRAWYDSGKGRVVVDV